MIKRIRFATRRADVSADDFAAGWRQSLAASAAAPPQARPHRAAVCATLPALVEPAGPPPRHDALGIEWFADTDHLTRFEDWLAGPAGDPARAAADRVAEPERTPPLAASESVLRGADWLAGRWRDGGRKLKHMALAVRADGLTPAEFAQRWRGHAGTLGSSSAAPPTVIPDHVRGLAYLQNHPVPRGADGAAGIPADVPYDAVNEVYFERQADLRARIAWFDANLRDQTADLISQSWFLPVAEEIVAY